MLTESRCQQALEGFLTTYSLLPNEYTDTLAVRATICEVITPMLHEVIVRLASKEPESPAGAIENVLNRGLNMCRGAMVAEASGLFAQSEVLSRSALEYAAKVRYILSGDSQDRYTAYMLAFPDSVEAGLKKWERESGNLPEPARSNNLESIAQMRKVNEDRIHMLSGFNRSKEPFPKQLIDIFSGAGMQMAYRTLYWRLSSQAHGDAEDTIFYLGALMLKQSGNEEGFELGAKEAVIFSVWYSHMVLEEMVYAAHLFHEKFSGETVPNEALLRAHAGLHADSSILAQWMAAPSLETPVWGGSRDL